MNILKLTPLCAAMLAFALAGCAVEKDDDVVIDDTVPAASDMPDAGTAYANGDGVITVASADQGGPYITDSAGNSLYMLENDADGTACIGDCLSSWPPVLVTDVQPSVDLGSNLDANLLGTIERDDGTLQLTYNGRPLYRYAADTGANRIAGHGLEDRWGHWYLVGPTGDWYQAGTTADASMVTDPSATDLDAVDD